MKVARGPRRSGMLIPLVLIVFVVVAILGVTLMFSGTSEYSQSALAGYGLRARELALAGLEEARMVVYDQVNRPGADPPPWKQELYDAVLAKVAAGDTGPVLPVKDLIDLVPRARQLASDGDGQIQSATVDFYGFRRIFYYSDGFLQNDSVYYRDPDRKLDPDPIPPAREYQGHYRIDVTARYGGAIRRVQSNHDVKIVFNAPFARQFALFSFLSSRGGQPGGPPDDNYGFNDLNGGGSFKVYGNGTGRVFVRGPFVVEAEGRSDGVGGKKPQVSTSFSRNRWPGWSAIPAIRDAILYRAGPLLINFPVDPARPNSTSGSRYGLPAIQQVLTGGLGAVLGDDPGWYLLNNQQWYCAFRPHEFGAANRRFSVIGDPQRPRPAQVTDPPGGFSMFRGMLTRYDESRRAVVGAAEQVAPGLVTTDGQLLDGAPGNDELRWVLEPEGDLVGLYQRMRYQYSQKRKWYYPPLFYKMNYSVIPQGSAASRLGVHWEKKYTQGWLDQFLNQLFTAGSVLVYTVAMGDVTSLFGLELVDETGKLTTAGWTLVLGTIGAGIGASLTRPDEFQPIPPPDLSAAAELFPPEYRIVSRAITRYYRASLGDLPTMQGGVGFLQLDGVVGFDDLSTPNGFRYQGRGVLYSDNASSPTMTTPISRTTGADWLFLHYNGPLTDAHQGQSMLRIRQGTGGPRGTVIATVYSSQGVQPEPGSAIEVSGNLVAGYINKSRIPDDGRVDLVYDHQALGGRPAAEFVSGAWHTVAVSHRPSAFAVTGGE